MPVFSIPSNAIQGSTLRISEPLFSHIYKSLRIRVGETLWVADEQRTRYLARISQIEAQALLAEILERKIGPPPKYPALVLGQAILKGDRMNWLLQKATELGTSVIVPLISARVVVQLRPERLSGYQERWQRIVMEAAQQSEQWTIPEVAFPCSPSDFGKTYGEAAFTGMMVERHASEGISTAEIPTTPQDQIVLMVGPEGGWTTEEVEEAQLTGFKPLTLGEPILRGETAALAALAILQSRLGALG